MVTVKLNMFGCGEVAMDGFSALASINAFATAGRVGFDKVSYRPNFPAGLHLPAEMNDWFSSQSSSSIDPT